MRVLVTGSSGFIGGAISQSLLNEGHTVYGASRSAHSPLLISGGLHPLPNLIQFLLSDGEDSDLSKDLTECLGDIDVVIHAAGNPKFTNGLDFQQSNVFLTKRLLRLVEQKCPKLRNFIFLSSVGAMDRPRQEVPNRALTEDSPTAPSSDYGRSKLEAEGLVAASRTPHTILRLGMVVGASMRPDSHVHVLLSARSRVIWLLMHGLQGRLPVVDVRDVCSAIILVMGETANVETSLVVGSSPTIAEVASLKSGRRNYRLPFVPALRRGLPFRARAIVSPELWVESTRLHQLGWSPEFSWQESVLEVEKLVKTRQNPSREPPGLTLVTGASSGLGEAIARHLVNRKLVLVDRDEPGLKRVAADVGATASIVADLTDGVENQLDRVAGEHGLPFAEAFLCAGAGSKETFGLHDNSSDLAYAINLNLAARIRISGQLLPYMRAINFGRIILISSSTAFAPIPNFAVYSASNAGLLAFGQALAQEVDADGIHVLTVCPSGMATNFQSSAGVRRLDGEVLLDPEMVAQKILLGLSRPKRKILIVGRNSHLSNALHRVVPRNLESKLWGLVADSRR